MAPTSTPIQRHPSPDAGGHDHAADDAPLVGGLTTTLGGESVGTAAAREEQASVIPGGLVLARVVPGTDAAGLSAVVQRSGAPSVDASGETSDVVAPLLGAASIASVAAIRPTLPSPGTVRGSPMETASASTSAHAGATHPAGHRVAQRAAVGQGARVVPGGTVAGAVTARTGNGTSSPVGAPLQRIARPPVGAEPGGGRSATASSGPAAAPDLVLARTSAAFVASAHDPVAIARGGGQGSPTHQSVLRDASDEATAEDEPATPATPESMARPADGATVSSSAAPAGTSGGAGPMPERDLDEMVRRLYPRLRRSLSSELLVARERAGTLADLR
ncbi:MAG: hypothetical protein ABWZ82_00160 [Candidatus Limnocylindrales bacterium]